MTKPRPDAAPADLPSGPDVREELSRMRARPRSRARHLPGWMYTSPEVFALETERLFLKEWLVVGRAEEIAAPGDYLTFDIVDEPIVVTRGRDGGLHAFSNVCRHRGARVVEGRGNARAFSCPYHGWTYDIAGKLVRTTFTDDVEGFDFDDCRLARAGVGEWGGWLFVNFDADAAPLAEHVAPYRERLGHFRQEDCRLGGRLDLEAEANWKLIAENLIDVYHFHVLHAASFGGDGNRNRMLPYPENELVITRPNSRSLTPTGEALLGRLPWIDEDAPAAAGHMPPNAYFTCHGDSVKLWMSWPLGPARARIIVYSIYAPEQIDRDDFAEKAKVYDDFLARIVDEDMGMVTALQKNMASRRFRPGPMVGLESGVRSAVNTLIDRLSDG